MTPPREWFVRAMPAVFIPVWSTGFIVARYGMPHAPPLAFLSCVMHSRCTVQLLAALAVTLPFVPLEHGSIVLHPELVAAMAWSVIGLTIGGSSLLYMLIQSGAATQVTSLLYLVPPCTALMAWALFDEPVTLTMTVGMVLVAAAVALVVRAPPNAA